MALPSRGLRILFICLALTSALPIRSQNWSLEDTVVITDVNIVDVRTGAVLPEQTVVIDKGRILAVGSRKQTRYPRNAPVVINGKGFYLVPGLWDMHVHLVFGDWFPRAQEISLPLFVANGVTGVRDMGSELGAIQIWRNEIEGQRLISGAESAQR